MNNKQQEILWHLYMWIMIQVTCIVYIIYIHSLSSFFDRQYFFLFGIFLMNHYLFLEYFNQLGQSNLLSLLIGDTCQPIFFLGYLSSSLGSKISSYITEKWNPILIYCWGQISEYNKYVDRNFVEVSGHSLSCMIQPLGLTSMRGRRPLFLPFIMLPAFLRSKNLRLHARFNCRCETFSFFFRKSKFGPGWESPTLLLQVAMKIFLRLLSKTVVIY